jgi:hypothetical protein
MYNVYIMSLVRSYGIMLVNCLVSYIYNLTVLGVGIMLVNCLVS